MESNIFIGIFLHALGGIAAATCFVPQKGTTRWSYQSFWLLMTFSAWMVIPIVAAYFTVPGLWQVIQGVELKTLIYTTLLGAVYGFGGMAFGMAIRYIGFSLTYAIAIGISAILGTVVPGLIAGTLLESFEKPGGTILFTGFGISMIGIFFCGFAGSLKNKEVTATDTSFDLKKGLTLAVIAGVLSASFGLALSIAAPLDQLAAAHGAGQFQSNVSYIFAMGGAFLTNLIWWGIVHFRKNTWREYLAFQETPEEAETSGTSKKRGSLPTHYLFAILGGTLWYVQFFFYGLGHSRMGDLKFISWGIHMAMLIFFSFGIGLILKEWKGLSGKTIGTLIVGLVILLISFGMITYAGALAEQATAGH